MKGYLFSLTAAALLSALVLALVLYDKKIRS